MTIFEVKTIDGKMIRLTEAQWLHIKRRHPEMSNRVNNIEDAVTHPTVRVQHSGQTTKLSS